MKIIYFVNHAAFFVSHRLPIAKAMQEKGHEVLLVTGKAGSISMEAAAEAELAQTGIQHSRLRFGSQSLNPFAEAAGFLGLLLYLHRERPDLLHCASPKAVLYGALAARLCRIPALVLSVSGMGYVFTEGERRSKIRQFLALVYDFVARLAFGHKNKRVIVQNQGDWTHFVKSSYAEPLELRLIPGSGVDLVDYEGVDFAEKKPIVLFPARILRDKGAMEFVEAARQVRVHAPEWRFVMAGAADYQNPTTISADIIANWQGDGVIEWLGHVVDMTSLFRVASIACLPSYREGMPKALIEAAAAGCAVITTDTIGCRDAIIPEETGDLVPLRDPAKLRQALLDLIGDPARRELYGRAGIRLARERYNVDSVINHTDKIYNELV